MRDDDPSIRELKHRQQDTERAEREQLAEAETDAEADRHRRRADKAHYLREKLAEQEESERDAGDDSGSDRG